MHANVLQLNRVAILIEDSESVLARLDATETHRADGSIEGRLVSPADHVEAWLGLRAVA